MSVKMGDLMEEVRNDYDQHPELYITEGDVGQLFNELIGIRWVGKKTAPLFIRDMVSFYHLRENVAEEDLIRMQPVDTWIRKQCATFGWTTPTASDGVIWKKILDECNKAGVSPIEFNQGLVSRNTRA